MAPRCKSECKDFYFSYAPPAKLGTNITKAELAGEPQATPSTYCSLETLKIPAGLSYGGALTVQ